MLSQNNDQKSRLWPRTKRTRAIEIKRYASNCNYTVNLLQSVFGISNFGVLEGASNGLEMVPFFSMKAYKLLTQFMATLFFPMEMLS